MTSIPARPRPGGYARVPRPDTRRSAARQARRARVTAVSWSDHRPLIALFDLVIALHEPLQADAQDAARIRCKTTTPV